MAFLFLIFIIFVMSSDIITQNKAASPKLATFLILSRSVKYLIPRKRKLHSSIGDNPVLLLQADRMSSFHF